MNSPNQQEPPECCPVPKNDQLFREYHDNEWGVPQSCDQLFFEKLCLEGFQAGLSWRTILHRREAFRAAFDHFSIKQVAQYGENDIQRLVSNDQIIRNRRKIVSAINNAKQCLELQRQYGSLAAFFWRFEPLAIQRPEKLTLHWLTGNTFTAESSRLSDQLKSLGFSYVGPTNLYALMQAMGIVNDHVEGCPRRDQIAGMRNDFIKPEVTIP